MDPAALLNASVLVFEPLFVFCFFCFFVAILSVSAVVLGLLLRF